MQWCTKPYYALEFIDGAYGPQADMWSMGCILYEMLVGSAAFPWNGKDDDELFDRIQAKKFDAKCKEYLSLSDNARALI